MAPLVLYHCAPSAPSRIALLSIRQLELDVEVKTVNLFAKEQLKPEFLKINPQHCVPTIDDNGFCLWESRAIAQYLVESKAPGSSLFPTDPAQRALVNQRLYFDAGTMYPRIRAICYPVIYLGETKISEEKRNQVYEAFGFLEQFLDGHKWFCGDNMTIADLSLLASVSSIIHVGASITKYPNIERWYNQCRTDVKGFDENEQGAKFFAERVTTKLEEQF
ncbi:unnamed protein product [Diamesa tonsa]